MKQQPIIRDLELEDIYKREGLADCLNQIAEFTLTKKALENLYLDRQNTGMRTLVAVVGDYILGTGTLIVEQKLIHNGGKVGHIEDVAVVPSFQKLGIGRRIINELISIAETVGCYKILLTCKENNIPFYEKLGFHIHEHSMRLDLCS